MANEYAEYKGQIVAITEDGEIKHIKVDDDGYLKVNMINADTNTNIKINDEDISDTNPIPVTKSGSSVSASITRPANTTLYTALDVICSSSTTPTVSTFSNVSTNTGAKVKITRAWIRIDVNAVPAGMSGFYVHLYNANPTAIADNAAYDIPEADRAKYIDNIYITTPDDFGSTLYSSIQNIEVNCKLAAGSTTLYAILQTVGGFTPAGNSEVYTIGFEIEDV
jgi:hypothetical protein